MGKKGLIDAAIHGVFEKTERFIAFPEERVQAGDPV